MVASSMQHYITGCLQQKENERRYKIGYLVFAVLGMVGFLIYIIVALRIANGKVVEGAQEWFIVAGAVYLFLLFGMLVRSVVQLEKALKQTKENHSKRWQQIMIVTTFGLLVVV
jgi:high-affinity Fe2+/Pb2+ permease